MKRRALALALAAIMAVGILPSFAFAETAHDYSWYGDGSAAEYTIADAGDLFGFADIVNGAAAAPAKDSFAGKTVKLAADIDLSGEVWVPIGSSMYDHDAADAATKKFEGTFDGGGHTVSNLSSAGYQLLSEDVGPSNEYSYGLFGYAYGANIKNVKLSGVAINACDAPVDSRTAAGSGVAALVGYYVPKSGTPSTIENCHVLSGTVVASNNMGGLMGFLQVQGEDKSIDVTIKGCSNAASVTTKAREAGGILGLSQQSNFSNVGRLKFIDCTNSGAITAENGGGCSVAGGILGQEHTGSAYGSMQIAFDGCSNSGAITAHGEGVAEVHASGIGTDYYTSGSWLTAKDCSNTGPIVITGNCAATFAGGIFALAPRGTLDNCSNSGSIEENGVAMPSVLIDEVPVNLYMNGLDTSSVAAAASNYQKYELNGGETPSPRTIRVENGSYVYTTPDPVREGYTFEGWYTDAALTVPAAAFNNTETYYAKWSANSYTVHFDANGGSGAPMADQSFTYDKAGEALAPNTFAREHYTFTGWNTKADGTGKALGDGAVTPNATGEREVTLYAQWQLDAHTVTYKDGVGGSVFADKAFVTYYGAETPDFGADPVRPGYVFEGWNAVPAATVTGNVTYTAVWRAESSGQTAAPSAPARENPNTGVHK